MAERTISCTAVITVHCCQPTSHRAAHLAVTVTNITSLALNSQSLSDRQFVDLCREQWNLTPLFFGAKLTEVFGVTGIFDFQDSSNVKDLILGQPTFLCSCRRVQSEFRVPVLCSRVPSAACLCTVAVIQFAGQQAEVPEFSKTL
ncbi:hypothetical protein J6590_007494 [Homalodisca vitripennis]|nr:hypothetical protein J6590_007494 [Homalodisca vitripennis]